MCITDVYTHIYTDVHIYTYTYIYVYTCKYIDVSVHADIHHWYNTRVTCIYMIDMKKYVRTYIAYI